MWPPLYSGHFWIKSQNRLDPSSQDTLIGPKGGLIRGSPLYSHRNQSSTPLGIGRPMNCRSLVSILSAIKITWINQILNDITACKSDLSMWSWQVECILSSNLQPTVIKGVPKYLQFFAWQCSPYQHPEESLTTRSAYPRSAYPRSAHPRTDQTIVGQINLTSVLMSYYQVSAKHLLVVL